MKVLYCLPAFFEYRFPFHKRLFEMFENEYYVMYSPLRYQIARKEHLCQEIQKMMGDNAVPYTKEHVFNPKTRKWDLNIKEPRYNRLVPFTPGLYSAIKKVRPDVLITEGYFQWTPIVLLYGLLHRVPVYMGYERTLHTERGCGKLKLWQRKLFNKLLTGFLVNGTETKKYLESIGADSSKIHIGGMCADSDALKSGVAQFRADAGFSAYKSTVLGGELHPEGLCFLFSGNMVTDKGIFQLAEAWIEHLRQHPHDHLVMIGGGPELEAFRTQFGEMPSLHICGPVPYQEIHHYYAIADVFILPTLMDNWSLVVPEAMSCGLPVATSVYNGCYSDLIKEGANGYSFDTHNHEELVSVLDKFHHVSLEEMGRRSAEIEKQFDVEHSTKRVYDAIMDDWLGTHSK